MTKSQSISRNCNVFRSSQDGRTSNFLTVDAERSLAPDMGISSSLSVHVLYDFIFDWSCAMDEVEASQTRDSHSVQPHRQQPT